MRRGSRLAPPMSEICGSDWVSRSAISITLIAHHAVQQKSEEISLLEEHALLRILVVVQCHRLLLVSSPPSKSIVSEVYTEYHGSIATYTGSYKRPGHWYLYSITGMGPMPWTVNSELYPLWCRSTCFSIATSFNWLFNFLVAMTFLSLTEALTQGGELEKKRTYYILLVWCHSLVSFSSRDELSNTITVS